jgi:hypothetical protein
MASAVRKLFLGPTLLFFVLGAFSPVRALKTPFVDPENLKARVVNTLFADHLRSFAALEGLLQVYLTSYRGALQESLVSQSRWIEELRGSGDLVGGTSDSYDLGNYFLHGTGKGLRFYIDEKGAFHFVSAPGRGKAHTDIVVGFDPLRDAMEGMAKKPRGVSFFDEKNGTISNVYRRGRGKIGKRAHGATGDGVGVRFSRIGRVTLSKGIRLDGDRLFLVSEYDFPSVESRFILFGLFIVFALAILVVVSTGASLFGGISAGGRKMSGKSAEDDIISQIDREITAGVSAPKLPAVEKEAVSGLEDTGGEKSEEAVVSIDAELDATAPAEEAVASIDAGLERMEETAAFTDSGLEPTGEAAESAHAGPEKTEEASSSFDRGIEEPPAVHDKVPRVAEKGRSKDRGKTLENDGIIIKKS